jgi:hypothetical protein
MSQSKDLKKGIEMTDEELMEMTGGEYYMPCQKRYVPVDNRFKPLYGIIPAPEYGIGPIMKYGVQPLYGIRPEDTIKPLYGIKPAE